MWPTQFAFQLHLCCVKSQNSKDLTCTMSEAWNHARLHQLISTVVDCHSHPVLWFSNVTINCSGYIRHTFSWIFAAQFTSGRIIRCQHEILIFDDYKYNVRSASCQMFPGMRNRIPLLAGSRASLASPSGKKANEVTRNYTRLGVLTALRRKIPVFSDVIPSHSASCFWHLKGSQWLDWGRYTLLAQWHHHIWTAVHLTCIRMFGCKGHLLRHCVIVVSHCSWCLKLKVVIKLYLICEQEQLRQFTYEI